MQIMSNANNPANPSDITYEKDGVTVREIATGLTKREHFAGLAMQALLSNPIMGDSDLWEAPQEWVKQMTESGVEMADALLKELDK